MCCGEDSSQDVTDMWVFCMTILCGGEHRQGDIRHCHPHEKDLRQCQNQRILSVWQLAGRSITQPHAPLSQWNEEGDHYLSNNDSLIYQTLPFQISEALSEASNLRVCVRVYDNYNTAAIVQASFNTASHCHSTMEACVALCIQCVSACVPAAWSAWATDRSTTSLFGRQKNRQKTQKHTLHVSPGCLSGLCIS